MVTSINVLNPMENQCCSTFKLMLQFKYYFHKQWYNGDVISHLIVFVGSKSHVLAASYSAKYFNFVVKTAEN